MRSCVRTIAGLALSMLLGLAGQSAHADIYGYFDGDGNAHFATEALDARYKLMMHGDGDFDSGAIGRGLPAAGLNANPSRQGNPLLRYLSSHPDRRKYENLVDRAAAEFHLEPALLNAIMATESGFNPGAVSSKGAIGLMQIMPATAERYGLHADKKRSIAKKLTDPATNIRLAAHYLSDLENLFPQHPELVVASYNAGEGAVQKYRNRIPPFPETRNYVQLVSQFYQLYAPGAQVARGRANCANCNLDAAADTNVKATRVTMVIPAPRAKLMPDAPVSMD
ncbi:lytic transglycosylase domain-containing protein [Oxalobacteraceae bacterium CAVE-383]|nr:lytic transglycosylase domain-containing protein [Oxalobacteraceae bacterium CAVE-383]